MRTEGSRKAVVFSAITFLLLGGYFAYAAFLTGQPSSVPGIQPISAESGSDDDDSDSDEDEDDSDEDKDDNEDDDKDDSKSEKQKKEDERKREEAKKASERAREAAKDSSDDDMDDESDSDSDSDENEVEDESGDEMDDDSDDDREAMFKDRDKTIEKLNEKIAKAEKEILEKQAEGVDVSAALAQLALAKAGLGSVDAAFTANELDRIKTLAKATERLAHFARGKTLHDSEKVAKSIAKVEKRIRQTKEKIALLAQFGGNTAAYAASLAEAESALTDAKAQIAAGGTSLLAGLSALETIERRVKSIKNSVEGALFALGVSDDDEFENEHGVEVEDTSDDLSELADADEDHSALRTLAANHKKEAAKVVSLVRDLEDRNRIAKGLFGNDQDVLDALENEVAINESQIAAMQSIADKVTDNELNLLMNEKLNELKSENAHLANFIAAQCTKTGVFGWLFRLF